MKGRDMRFEKISFEAWKDWFNKNLNILTETEVQQMYDNIKLPIAGSQFAAGHDFYCPMNLFIHTEPILIPTGVRWITEEQDKDKVLIMVPRSGLGVKYGMRLTNTVGVIDADYYCASNEGHIMASVVSSFPMTISAGDRFMQGVILPYYRCGEESTKKRNGGFGSTGEK